MGSAEDLFTRDLWQSVAKDLRFVGAKWWRENQLALIGLTKAEMLDIAHALQAGDRWRAKEALVARMSVEQWQAYRDGTTAGLEELVARRAAAYEALKRIGWLAARVVGKALLAALL